MSEANLRQIRVLHIVSAGGVASCLQPSLFMPLLTRLPRQRVKAQVACLSPGAVPSAVLRQNGVPTFDLALSRKRFSPTAYSELVQSARHFRPDVIQAWGHTAQVISSMLRKRCDWKPRLVWSLSDTIPLAKNAGFLDRQKLKYATKFAARADRIIYTSEAAAAQHRRVGFPDGGHETVPPGVDATRFKPDFAARRKLREELKLPGETFVIGMVAPFQPEFDHATFLKGIGELVKLHPNVAVVLAGHGVQKGNAPLMALIGGGALATRVHLLGEWSDVNALYNACDLVCSSAVNDHSRMNVVMAMLCGVPCVATGIGAQGEVIGQHGVAIEPGNPAAFVKGITRVMQLSPEKRTHLAQNARKHALANYVYVRSLQKYLQLYYDLIGRQSLVTKDLPTPEIDPSLTVPPALPTEAEMNAAKRKPITVVDLSDPDSLESKVAERTPEELPKWRIEQEEERNKREAELAAQVAASKSVGDVLQVFESEQAKAASSETPMTERARGVADDTEELLSPELLAAEVPVAPRVSHGPSSSRKSASAAASPVSAQDAAKQAALKAARMAALQPIASRPVAAPKASSAVTRPPATKAASALTRPPATGSVTRPPATAPLTRPPAFQPDASKPVVIPETPALDVMAPAAISSSPDVSKRAGVAASLQDETAKSADVPAPATNSSPLDIGSTQPVEMLSQDALLQPVASNVPNSPAADSDVSSKAVADSNIASKPAADVKPEPRNANSQEILPEFALLSPVEPNASVVATVAGEKSADLGGTQPSEMLPEVSLLPPIDSNFFTAPVAGPAPVAEQAQIGTDDAELLPEMLPEIALFLDPQAAAKPAAAMSPAKSDLAAPAPETPPKGVSSPQTSKTLPAEAVAPQVPVVETKPPSAPEIAASGETRKGAFDSPQPMGMFSQALANATLRLAAFTSARATETSKAKASEPPTEVTPPAAIEQSLLEKIAPASVEQKKATPEQNTTSAASATSSAASATSSVDPTTSNAAPATSNQDFSELSLMATGQWMNMQWPGVKSGSEPEEAGELSGAEALSLISTPTSDTKSEVSSDDPTIKLALLPDPALEPKRAASGK